MINDNADTFAHSSLDFGYNDLHKVIHLNLYSVPICLNPAMMEIAQDWSNWV
jgi:hypothetical protein